MEVEDFLNYLASEKIAEYLGVTSRTALTLCNSWVDGNFLLQHGERRSRRYELEASWTELL